MVDGLAEDGRAAGVGGDVHHSVNHTETLVAGGDDLGRMRFVAEEDVTLAELSERLGYRSEAAFSRASLTRRASSVRRLSVMSS